MILDRVRSFLKFEIQRSQLSLIAWQVEDSTIKTKEKLYIEDIYKTVHVQVKLAVA